MLIMQSNEKLLKCIIQTFLITHCYAYHFSVKEGFILPPLPVPPVPVEPDPLEEEAIPLTENTTGVTSNT